MRKYVFFSDNIFWKDFVGFILVNLFSFSAGDSIQKFFFDFVKKLFAFPKKISFFGAFFAMKIIDAFIRIITFYSITKIKSTVWIK